MSAEMIEKAARAIRATDGANVGWEGLGESTKTMYRDYARAVIAAIHPTVDSVEELDALPVGSVILDGDPCVLQMVEKSDAGGSKWATANEEYLYHAGKITFPATVLHSGGAA